MPVLMTVLACLQAKSQELETSHIQPTFQLLTPFPASVRFAFSLQRLLLIFSSLCSFLLERSLLRASLGDPDKGAKRMLVLSPCQGQTWRGSAWVGGLGLEGVKGLVPGKLTSPPEEAEVISPKTVVCWVCDALEALCVPLVQH